MQRFIVALALTGLLLLVAALVLWVIPFDLLSPQSVLAKAEATVNLTEFVCTINGPEGKPIRGDCGPFFVHNGKTYLVAGDSWNNGQYSPNTIGVCESGKIIEDGFIFQTENNGAFKQIAPKYYPVSTLIFGAITVVDELYLYCTHVADWPSSRSRGFLIKKRSNAVYEEIWWDEWNGLFQATCPVWWKHPRTGKDIILLFSTPGQRRGPIYASYIDPENIEDLGSYTNLRTFPPKADSSSEGWHFPITDGKTAEYSVIRDSFTGFYLLAYWDFQYHPQRLMLRYFESPLKDISQPICLWDNGHADWMDDLTFNYYENMTQEQIEKAHRKLYARNPEKASKLLELIEKGKIEEIKEYFTKTAHYPYGSYMLNELNDEDYIYILVNVELAPFTSVILRVKRDEIGLK